MGLWDSARLNTEQEPPLEYVRFGLTHEDPQVRWYCAYKLGEHLAKLEDADRKQLEALTEDAEFKVRQAALFTLQLVDGSYEGDAFIHTPDGKAIIFHRYREARYNDGNVWMVKDGKTVPIYRSEVSITKLTVSPDSRWLAVEFGGRQYNAIDLIDLKTLKPRGMTDLIQKVIASNENGYPGIDLAQIDRPDPQVSLLEWEPDSKQFRFSYAFFSSMNKEDSGTAIYEIEADRVTTIWKADVKG